MSLPNWLVPAGELVFTGGEKALQKAVHALDGKSGENGSFVCRLGGGPASFRFKMVSVFSCTCKTVPEGCRIGWQVRPALSVLALFAALAVVSLAALAGGGLELAGLCGCLLAMLVCLYAIQRSHCIQEFCTAFGAK